MANDPQWTDITVADRKKRRRRGPRNKARGSAKQMARQALREVSKLQAYTETKYYDFAGTITGLDRDGDLSIWNPIPQGDTDITRDGDALYMMNVHIRASLWHDPQTGNQGAAAGFRFILFLDKSNTITSVSDLLDLTGDDETNMLSPITWDIRKQIKVLHDSMITVDGVWKERLLKEWVIQIRSKTQFSAGTTTITTNALKGCWISDRASTDSYLPKVLYYYRITFKDS
jgi:hypothetical protein